MAYFSVLQAVAVPRESHDLTPHRPSASSPLPPVKESKKSGKIMLPTMEGFVVEKWKHIVYIEAQGNYTLLHLSDRRQVLVCKTLRDMEARLPKPDFVRIHRSFNVHLRHLLKYHRGKGGAVCMLNGVVLGVSAGYREQFFEALNRYFY